MSISVTYTYSVDGLAAFDYPITLLASGTANTPPLQGEGEVIGHNTEACARAYCRAHYQDNVSWIRRLGDRPILRGGLTLFGTTFGTTTFDGVTLRLAG